MKNFVLLIISLILIIITSYLVISLEQSSYTLKTYVIRDNQENTETDYANLNTFTISHESSGNFKLMQTYKKTRPARKRNIMYQQRDEEIDKCIKKITKNWKRTYFKKSYEKVYDDNEGKWVHTEGSPFYEKEKEFYGYDEAEDWGLRWRLKNRALNHEKIC